MIMKIRSDDPRLTSYHLGELSSSEMLEVERSAAADPAVRMALEEAGRFTGFLGDMFGGEARHALRPAQREAVRRAGREADSVGKVVELKSSRRSARPWLTGLAAAAVVTFAAVLMSRLGDTPDGPTTREVALLPQPGPGAWPGTTGAAAGGAGESAGNPSAIARPDGAYLEAVAQELSQGTLPSPDELSTTADQAGFSSLPELRLPVSIGNASAIWVKRWIEERNALPPKGAVRVEEMVNAVSLPASVEVEGLMVGIHQLDWGGSRWIGVQVASGEEAIDDLEIRSFADSARRVVGSFGQRSDQALPRRLEAGRSVLVLLEFDGESTDPGRLSIDVSGRSHEIRISETGETGHPALAHAVATAVFGRWLRGEAEADRLAQVIELADQPALDAEYRQGHRLMRQAMTLAE